MWLQKRHTKEAHYYTFTRTILSASLINFHLFIYYA